MKSNKFNSKISLGEKLKYFRKRSRLSQLHLENEADLSYGAVSRIENNQIEPTLTTIKKITHALDLSSVEIAYLFEINLYFDKRIKQPHK